MPENFLENLQLPDQLAELNPAQLEQLAGEVREMIIRTVAKNGGHLASNLGVVELTLALLLEYDFHRDRIVFDVGHQSYAWKILTGRRDIFCTLRKLDGLSGFPKQCESCYDFFNTGHSSTSISAALGLSRAMTRSNKAGRAIAVIGDGALTGGMAFEALNDAGQSRENLLVILNDNQMSISRNVGGLSRHLENLRISPGYIRFKTRVDAFLLKMPLLGRPLYKTLQRFKRFMRQVVQRQGIIFEQLGFRYYGPIDGHDIDSLRHHLRTIQQIKGPVLLHVMTQKGRGYRYAEESPDLYHGVAPFVVENGVANGSGAVMTFSDTFGNHLTEMARRDSRICAISAAMTSGTGLAGFAEAFPARFFDVGIAEQHAVTLSAGLAAGGMRPVIALYSTFLQRAYDQLLHDICLQNLPVVIAIDRAGIVGEDGETHQGIYDLGLLLPLPNLEVFCPLNSETLCDVMNYAIGAGHPVAIRYPRGREWQQPLPAGLSDYSPESLPIRKARHIREGRHVTLLALGTMAGPAMAAANILSEQGIEADVLAILCVKPLDMASIIESAGKTGHVVFIEESLKTGGFGQSALPLLLKAHPETRFTLIGVDSQPLCQGSRDQLLASQGLQPTDIAKQAADLVTQRNSH